MRILNWIKSLFDKDTEHLLIRIEELEENVNELIFELGELSSYCDKCNGEGGACFKCKGSGIMQRKQGHRWQW